MKEVIEFLTQNPNGCMATVCKGKPEVRPWQFMFEKDDKIWFCTANTKEVFSQLKKNPSIAFAATSSKLVTVRINGEIKFSSDFEIKKRIIESNPLVKSIFKEPDNPTFEVFYLDHGKAVMSDFSGQTPKVFEF